MIDYIVANPTGNITALVTSDVSASDRVRIAQMLMSPEYSREHAYAPNYIEQVGFISEGSGFIRIDMMGGEFCGNASLCTAAYYAAKNGIQPGQEVTVTVRSSGMDKPFPVKISATSSNGEIIYNGTIEMPFPVSISEYKHLPLVKFTGISHLIIPETMCSPDEAEFRIRDIAQELSVDALGILLYNESNCSIRPLVYVPATDTMVWEHGCASGSAAVGAYRYFTDTKNTASAISQPGGIIKTVISNGSFYLTGQILLYLPRKF